MTVDPLEEALAEVVLAAHERMFDALGAQGHAVVAAGGPYLPRAASLFDPAAWRADVNRLVRPVLESRFTRAAASVGLEATKAAARHAVEQAARIGDWGLTFASRVSDLVAAAVAEGRPVDSLADELRTATLSPHQVAGAAITEGLAAANAGLVLGAKQLGVRGTKTWVTRNDDRVRETHRQLHGLTIPIEASFYSGGHSCFYPGDPTLPIGQRIACRCRVEVKVLRRPAHFATDALTTEAFKARQSGWREWCRKNPDKCRGRTGDAVSTGQPMTQSAAEQWHDSAEVWNTAPTVVGVDPSPTSVGRRQRPVGEGGQFQAFGLLAYRVSGYDPI